MSVVLRPFRAVGIQPGDSMGEDEVARGGAGRPNVQGGRVCGVPAKKVLGFLNTLEDLINQLGHRCTLHPAPCTLTPNPNPEALSPNPKVAPCLIDQLGHRCGA